MIIESVQGKIIQKASKISHKKSSAYLVFIILHFQDILVQLHRYDSQDHFTPPQRTSSKYYLVITSLLLAALVSCALEIFMSRGRAYLCQLFYPDRELERSDYLYYQIITGNALSNIPLINLLKQGLSTPYLV